MSDKTISVAEEITGEKLAKLDNVTMGEVYE